MNSSRVRIDQFNANLNYTRNRPIWVMASWQIVKWAFFKTALPWPNSVKKKLLTLYGAKIGLGVVIKPQVNIHLPWKLQVGDYTWLGEEVYILNLEPVAIGSHACLSQRAFLCTGNHNYRDPSFSYINKPITIKDGAWIGAQAFVGPGVTIDTDTVVAAGSIVTRSVGPNQIVAGNPAIITGQRWRNASETSPLITQHTK
jgi:putative colanic acid biosynthesis acetyltransferase WcaF